MTEQNIDKIIDSLTLEEKAGLCSGLDFWHTKPVERLHIPSITMTDGPYGLRKQKTSPKGANLNESVPATCFPTGSAIACSWDRTLLNKVGRTIGEECQAENVNILLGPAVNVKRSPLCGRNFEYYSEDPFLCGELASAFIEGVQSENVGTSIKHFAANNQETNRLTISAQADKRVLREIYLAGFEKAIKKSKPWTVMCSYNKINGTYNSENKELLNDILKEEWGYEGLVMSDWGAVNNRVKGLAAGMDLEMPSSMGINDQKIVKAVKEGKISEEILDKAVKRIIKIVFKAAEGKTENAVYSVEEHHSIASEAEKESMVLLKNDNNILPLKRNGTIAVIGSFALQPRFEGGGSSHISPNRVDIPLDCIRKTAGANVNVTFAKGYEIDETSGKMFNEGEEFISKSNHANAELIEEAKKTAVGADVAVIFAGLPDSFESEGYDRLNMDIPAGHEKLIDEISKVQKHVVVVLCNGSPIEMPWADNVDGILECYLGGEAVGSAVAALLFGDSNPSGKLAETFPYHCSDNPSSLFFPGHEETVDYSEGLFVGYRYYDAKKMKPRYPFGYGLSYTTFAYRDISLSAGNITDEDRLNVSFKIKNTGKMCGKEIAQLYINDMKSIVTRPDKELKGFVKIELKPNEEKKVTIELDKRSFAYYDSKSSQWKVHDGDYKIMVGSSSADILLETSVHVRPVVPVKVTYTMNTKLSEILANPATQKALGDERYDSIKNMQGLSKNMPLRSAVYMVAAFREDECNSLLEKLNR